MNTTVKMALVIVTLAMVALAMVALAAVAAVDTKIIPRPGDCPSEAEVRQAMSKWLAGYLVQGLTPQDVAKELVRLSDGNVDSILGEEEFLMCLKVELRTPYIREVCYLFIATEVDVSGDGVIDEQELVTMIEAAAAAAE